MSSHTQVAAGNFGLSARLVMPPGTTPDEALCDVRCLLETACGVFDAMSDNSDLPEAYYGELYLLRLARIALHAVELPPAVVQAAAKVPHT